MRQLALLLIIGLQCVTVWRTAQATNSTVKPTTEMPCNHRNASCKDCVKGDKCYWCDPTSTCFYFESTISDPKPTTCKDNDWKVGQCFIPGNVLIIAVPSAVGFVLLVIIGCILYCCCCRKKKPGTSKHDKEDAKYQRQREEIEFKNNARREERKKKNDEIRKKYGLFKDDDEGEMGYRRFDNVA